MRMIPAFGSGWLTLLYKELLRFWKVSFQTIPAPVLSALLYLLIFSHVLESRVSVFDGRVAYTAFPDPGPGDDGGAAERLRQQLVVADPVEDHRQSDLRAAAAALAAGPLRRLCAGGDGARPRRRRRRVRGHRCVRAAGRCRIRCGRSPSRCSGSAILGTLGLIAGIWADKFDQLAAFQNFLIMPLTFLSGVFYSIHWLPPFWQRAVAFQSFLLYDRRLSLRLLRPLRRRAPGKPRHRLRVLPWPSRRWRWRCWSAATSCAADCSGLPRQSRQGWSALPSHVTPRSTPTCHAAIATDQPSNPHDHSGIHQAYDRSGLDPASTSTSSATASISRR